MIPSIEEVMAEIASDGIETLLVQPTHLMNGYEYGDLVEELKKHSDDFESIKIGAPLLTSDEDFVKTAQAMAVLPSS